MGQRLDLQAQLLTLLGSPNVYFQPPTGLQMQYPCIVYERDDISTSFADNAPYRHKTRYSLTVIDPDPDSEIPYRVAALPMCVFDRHYKADGLNHDVFNLFF